MWDMFVAYMQWALAVGVEDFGLPGPLTFSLALFLPLWSTWLVVLAFAMAFEKMWDA
jgi:hypothetical protein